MKKRIRAVVTGRVQGVWFRASTCEKARALGVTGYVRNLPDGAVEFVACGDPEKVDELIEWAREGPPLAKVERVEVVPLHSGRNYEDFRIA